MARPFPDEFSSLKSLEHLDLAYIGLQGQLPKFIGKLCKLKLLSLGANKLDGGIHEFLSGFSNCSRLELLDMSRCGLVGRLSPMQFFRNAKSLQHLYLGSNYFWVSIQDFTIGNLSSLKTLYLNYNLFNHFISESLGQLSQLDR